MSETDVSQLVELALNQFGDAWHCANVSYLWIHNHWSETKDKPKPKKWGNQIRKLEQAVRNALTLRSRPRSPPPGPRCASRSRSLSPQRLHARLSRPRSPQRLRARLSRPRSPPRSLGSSLGSSSSAPGPQDLEKRYIVARLMTSPDALPEQLDRSATSHVPRLTLDDWISELHQAVANSRLCSWPPGMTKREEGIQSLGISQTFQHSCSKMFASKIFVSKFLFQIFCSKNLVSKLVSPFPLDFSFLWISLKLI